MLMLWLKALAITVVTLAPAFSVAGETTAAPTTLPPGWTYGTLLDQEGNRFVLPLPPGIDVPPKIATREEPVERTKERLDILRLALEAYRTLHRPGISEYPATSNWQELAHLLLAADLLPAGWEPGGDVIAFQSTPTGYSLKVAVAGQEVSIHSPPWRNPYAMFWVPPHVP
ncbi:MAG: hypothetical protein HY692_06940 [Cyanobacteria bacterium NC_groundwater_1444_Ag_S-0.65um_54_12]|nr:hypothetical protein [Cyanobacteria bacterium NC_groundwater_1444_Ag_S-0.65um_54_12]